VSHGVDVDIASHRLRNQRIEPPLRLRPAALVAWLGAVQAQEYPFAKWALALRLAGDTTDADIERDFDAGRILRTHVLRPTWHFVSPDDIGWMLQLTGPRVHTHLASYSRRRGLESKTLIRAATVFERALGSGQPFTRAELGAVLARAGITLDSFQLALAVVYAELEGVVCSGPRRGKKFTYALVSDRAPGTRRLSREESLAELTRRYFASHGPATVRDFVWWSSVTTADARRGLDMIRARPLAHDGLTYWRIPGARAVVSPGPTVRLLPIYDEYLVSYRDRLAVPHSSGSAASGATTVTFRHALVISGQVAGTWNTGEHPTGVAVRVTPARQLTRTEQRGVEAAAGQYGRFLGREIRLTIA
jgi:Winged helix DNA-binding domain